MADDIALEGKTTVDDKMVFEPQRLSYDAARHIAEKIARRISERTKGNRVVIAGTQLLADLSNLVATRVVLEGIAGEYDALAKLLQSPASVFPGAAYSTRSIVPPARFVPPTLDAVTAGAKGALALLSLFRQDVDYKGVPVSIDTLGFELELASRIRMHKAREVIIPDFAVFTAPDAGANGLQSLVEKVRAARRAFAETIAAKLPKPKKLFPLELRQPSHDTHAEHSAQHGHAEHANAEEAAAPEMNLDGISEALAQIDQRFNDLETQLSKMDTDGSGLTMLSRLYRAEWIQSRRPMFVHARVLLAGGSNRISRSLLRTIFMGDGLSSSGGAVVSWAILSEHGAVEDGGVFTESMSALSPKPPETAPSLP